MHQRLTARKFGRSSERASLHAESLDETTDQLIERRVQEGSGQMAASIAVKHADIGRENIPNSFAVLHYVAGKHRLSESNAFGGR